MARTFLYHVKFILFFFHKVITFSKLKHEINKIGSECIKKIVRVKKNHDRL